MYYCDVQLLSPWEENNGLEVITTFWGSDPQKVRGEAEQWARKCYEYRNGDWGWDRFRFLIYTKSDEGHINIV